MQAQQTNYFAARGWGGGGAWCAGLRAEAERNGAQGAGSRRLKMP